MKGLAIWRRDTKINGRPRVREGETPDPCCFSEDMAMATEPIVARSEEGRDR